MREIFSFFIKIGSTGFGGPIALIGMMERHWVRKRKKISESEFQRFVSTAKLFPGTIAPLVAIRIGYELEGRWGGTLAGLCLILPAFFLVLFLSHFMSEIQSHPHSLTGSVFLGFNLGGLALSLIAAIRFTKPLLSLNSLFYLISAGVLTFLFPRQEIFFLLAAGSLSLFFHYFRNSSLEIASALLLPLFLESLKASLFTFGSGIAIVPVLKAIYLDQYHWVSETDFLTALGVGQITPGPLVIMNTYLGKQVAGTSGALASSLGTFLPTFFFGLVLMPAFEKKLLKAQKIQIFFKGMLPAVGGAILGSVIRLLMFGSRNSAGEFSPIFLGLILGLALCGFFTRLHPILILMTGSILTVAGFLSGIIQ